MTAEMIERGRGSPSRLAQKRRVSSSLRETREKLTSAGTGARSSDIELIRQFASSRVTAMAAMIGLTVI
ncbi:MAG TPA: sensor histidine kinase, partial [Beijerinckiaceae bacterium]